MIDTVQIRDLGTPVTNLTAMTCPMARNFAGWVRYGAQPAAQQYLGSGIARIESYGSFACRPIAGSSRLSEHGRANAVDIAAFVLTDGRRISVKQDWYGPDVQARDFLRRVHASACRRFANVLGPDYNAAHNDHLHFDLRGRESAPVGSPGFCK